MLTKVRNKVIKNVREKVISSDSSTPSGPQIDFELSTLIASPASIVADNTATTTVTWSPVDALGNPLAETADNIIADLGNVSPVFSTVQASPGLIANDGVAESVITLTLYDAQLNPIVGLPADKCVLSVTGSNNTVVQPTGVTDALGKISGTLKSTSVGTKVASFTVLGVLLSNTASIQSTSDVITLGAGPNAPAWSGKTAYTEELFLSPIPVMSSPAPATIPSGFRGYDGFNGYYGASYEYDYVTYPVVSTPIGTKPVLRALFPGSTRNITAVNQVSETWLVGVNAAGIRVTGTWVGTLSFERSLDNGVTWNPVTLTGAHGSANTDNSTINGVWSCSSISNSLFRVRASSWTSGTAKVDVGWRGGAAPVRMSAGPFTSNPTRIYTRCLIYIDPAWFDNGNAGTKFTFFSQNEGNNHFWGLWTNSGSQPSVILQQTANIAYTGTPGPANGVWLDFEAILTAGTAGGSDGTAKVWINNLLLLDITGVPFFDSAATSASFTGLWMDPTFGGGGRPPDRNQYFDIAGWYRESAP
jgi:hypothetical protein